MPSPSHDLASGPLSGLIACHSPCSLCSGRGSLLGASQTCRAHSIPTFKTFLHWLFALPGAVFHQTFTWFVSLLHLGLCSHTTSSSRPPLILQCYDAHILISLATSLCLLFSIALTPLETFLAYRSHRLLSACPILDCKLLEARDFVCLGHQHIQRLEHIGAQ